MLVLVVLVAVVGGCVGDVGATVAGGGGGGGGAHTGGGGGRGSIGVSELLLQYARTAPRQPLRGREADGPRRAHVQRVSGLIFPRSARALPELLTLDFALLNFTNLEQIIYSSFIQFHDLDPSGQIYS